MTLLFGEISHACVRYENPEGRGRMVNAPLRQRPARATPSEPESDELVTATGFPSSDTPEAKLPRPGASTRTPLPSARNAPPSPLPTATDPSKETASATPLR